MKIPAWAVFWVGFLITIYGLSLVSVPLAVILAGSFVALVGFVSLEKPKAKEGD